jgi:hypothetical protein
MSFSENLMMIELFRALFASAVANDLELTQVLTEARDGTPINVDALTSTGKMMLEVAGGQ